MARILTALAIVLSGTAALVFFLLENPDQFKAQMTQALTQNTDYEIEINGELTWRYWPPIAIEANDISLLRGGEPLGQFSRMEIDVDLMPLLTQQRIIDINLIYLEGGEITLIVDEQGHGNWQKRHGQKNGSQPDASSTASDRSASPPVIHEVSIQQLGLSYADQRTAENYTVAVESLRTTRLAIDSPFDVSLAAIVTDNANALTIDASTTGQLTYRSNERLSFSNLVISANINQASNQLPVLNLTTVGEWHPGRQVVVFNKADLSVGTLQASMTGLLNLAGSVPRFDGELNLESADLGQFAETFDFDVPVGTLQLNTGLKASSDHIHLDSLDGSFDDTRFKGKTLIEFETTFGVSGDLRLDRLETARYLAEPTRNNTANRAAEPGASADPELIPVTALRSILLETIVRIDELQHESYEFSGAKIELKNDTRQLNLIANAQAFSGKVVFSLDTQLQSPVTSEIKLSLDRIDVASLSEVQDLTGELTGHSRLAFDGQSLGDLGRSLTGKSVFTVTDGTLNVTSLKRLAATIDMLRGKQSSISNWPDFMPFDHLTAQHIFNNGTATGQVLNSHVENLKITALGGFDLDAETLDYQVTAIFDAASNGQFEVSDQLSGIRWPMTCQGAFTDSPSDLCLGQEGAINDLVMEIAKQDLKRRGDQKIEELIEDKVPDELKNLTRDLFKDLFK